MKPGTIWQPVVTTNRSGREISFAVLLCVDFINEHDSNIQRYVPRDLWQRVYFGVVPSYSPTLRDFEQRARPVAERIGRPIAYSNMASMGGSRMYCLFGETAPFLESHGTKALSSGDEAVIVVDLPLGEYAQFLHRPTPLPNPPSWRVVRYFRCSPEKDLGSIWQSVRKSERPMMMTRNGKWRKDQTQNSSISLHSLTFQQY